MSLGRQNRYFCTNVLGCSYARRDLPYSETYFKRHQGICRGHNDDGCKAPLHIGDPLDRRVTWTAIGLAAIVGVTGLVWQLGPIIFPAPIEHVSFATQETRTVDGAALLEIEVDRTADLDRRAVIHFETMDGTAKAGQDYESTTGLLTFAPGEREKSVQVAIVPDPTFQKPARHFSIVLVNVVGPPRHVIFIDQPKIAVELKAHAEQLVRAASVVAKDIADNVVKLRAISDLLSTNRRGIPSIQMYEDARQITQGNLNRARESYVQFLRDMLALQPRSIFQAMDAVSATLERQGMKQQAQATLVMKRQFQEFLARKITNMDQWAIELGEVIPKAGMEKGKNVI